jgi:hypothetical protein
MIVMIVIMLLSFASASLRCRPRQPRRGGGPLGIIGLLAGS